MKQLQGYTVGAIAPSNPRAGDVWHELSTAGVSVYGWDWVWSAGRWSSPEQFWDTSYDSNTGIRINYLDIDPRVVRLLEFRSRLIHFVAQNTSNHWKIDLNFTNNGNVKTQLSQLLTAGSGSSIFTPQSAQLSTLVDFRTTGENSSSGLFETFFSPVGSPGAVWGTVRLKYQFVR